MIITKQKAQEEILKAIGTEKKVFIVGCGECSTTCLTGGEREVLQMKGLLQSAGKVVTGYVVPKAPCVASQIRMALAKEARHVKEADCILVLACGLGVQSVAENERLGLPVHVGCDTLFMGALDASGKDFIEFCSACGECLLDKTGTICPITRCAKGLLNGPCGGAKDGKCEVDKTRDCAWILIYNKLKQTNKLSLMKEMLPPKDYQRANKPHSLSLP